MSHKLKSLFFATITIGALFVAGGHAFAQMESSILFVAPHRLVMDPSEKVEVLNVANKSDQTHRYDLTLIDQVMNEDGSTIRKDTYDYSAKRMIRFVPKRFTLKPGERQVVRVMIKRPGDLADGDYHSHLLFREVPLNVQDKQALKDQRAEENKGKAANFEIRALYGVAVPIVVQHGKIESAMTMADAGFTPATDKEPAMLAIKFDRAGNAEAAAQISAAYIKADGSAPVQVLEPLWVRIYREVNGVSRKFPIKDIPEGVTLSGGKLVLTLTKSGSDTETSAAEGQAKETSITREIQLP